MTAQPRPPKIAIIGAGPSGLVLLNVLARNGVGATLYERDAEFGARAHLGGTLDLHADAGQAALKAAGVWDAFAQHARPEGQEIIIFDKTGETAWHFVPPAGAAQHARPEIDRTALRRIMVDAAPPGSIQWGHELVGAAAVGPESAEWELTFANGVKTVVDLLVGADGGRSRVRPLVSDAAARFVGITGIETSFEASAQPALAARVGAGSLFVFADNQCLLAQRNGDGRIRTYAFFHHDDPEYIPSIVADPDRAVAEVLTRYADWAPWQRQLVEAADRHAIYARPLYMLPVGHSWPHKRGVTLIGDALNLMTPFAGRGANVAMLAGLKLGLAIASAAGRSLEELDAKVAEYEKEIVPIAEKDAALTEKNMNITMFDGNGAKVIARKFVEQIAPHQRSVIGQRKGSLAAGFSTSSSPSSKGMRSRKSSAASTVLHHAQRHVSIS